MPSAFALIALLKALTIWLTLLLSEPVHWYVQPSSLHASCAPYRVGTKNGFVVTWLTNTNLNFFCDPNTVLEPEPDDAEAPLPPLPQAVMSSEASPAAPPARAVRRVECNQRLSGVSSSGMQASIDRGLGVVPKARMVKRRALPVVGLGAPLRRTTGEVHDRRDHHRHADACCCYAARCSGMTGPEDDDTPKPTGASSSGCGAAPLGHRSVIDDCGNDPHGSADERRVRITGGRGRALVRLLRRREPPDDSGESDSGEAAAARTLHRSCRAAPASPAWWPEFERQFAEHMAREPAI